MISLFLKQRARGLGVIMYCLIALNGAAVGGAAALTPDMLAIQGSWVRADAPYVIEMAYATDGLLRATYFNRRPIHVEKVETASQKGALYVMIVLQDRGYQGSTYILSYDRRTDMLHGTYMHGASKQTFDVQFRRKRTR